jgi:hypothetical protein
MSPVSSKLLSDKTKQKLLFDKTQQKKKASNRIECLAPSSREEKKNLKKLYLSTFGLYSTFDEFWQQTFAFIV